MTGLKVATALLELLLTVVAKVEQKNAQNEVQEAADSTADWYAGHFGMQQPAIREETTKAGTNKRQAD